jgi:hypothetical protein
MKPSQNLLRGYQADFAKYSGVINAAHIIHIFEAIFKQLTQFQSVNF